MSLPGLVAQPLTSLLGPAAVATISPLEAIIGSFNGNLYFIGIMMKYYTSLILIILIILYGPILIILIILIILYGLLI